MRCVDDLHHMTCCKVYANCVSQAAGTEPQDRFTSRPVKKGKAGIGDVSAPYEALRHSFDEQGSASRGKISQHIAER